MIFIVKMNFAVEKYKFLELGSRYAQNTQFYECTFFETMRLLFSKHALIYYFQNMRLFFFPKYALNIIKGSAKYF